MTEATAPSRAASALRAQAAARLAELGLPTARLEEWRFTNPAPITRVDWADPPAAPSRAAATTAPPPWPRHAVDVLDGASSTSPARASRTDDRRAARRRGRVAARRLGHDRPGRRARPRVRAAERGARRRRSPRPGGARAAIAHPVVLVHARGARPDGAPVLVAPRALVEVGPGASVTVVEDFRGLAAGADFTNTVTEIIVAEGAACTLLRLVGERAQGFHVGLAAARLARDARSPRARSRPAARSCATTST